MKNQKWRRKAKRLFGYCISRKCTECKYYKVSHATPYETDFDCFAPSYLPSLDGIRMLEKEFKNKK